MKALVSLTVLIATLLVACVTSPTGRTQLLLMPANEMDQMGIAAFTDMKSKVSIESSATVNRYVSCVATAITSVLDPKDQRQWEVVVFSDDTANAFALPGGKIGVHTGLLKVAVNQDQLGSVIGHEVGHVLAQHGNERMSLQFASQTSQQLMGVLLANNSQKPLLMAAMGIGAQYGLQLPFSRTHESEADSIGLQLMAKAGFQPQASVQVWRNMSANSDTAPPEFLSTHPANQTRITRLESEMTSALAVYNQARSLGRRPNCSL